MPPVHTSLATPRDLPGPGTNISTGRAPDMLCENPAARSPAAVHMIWLRLAAISACRKLVAHVSDATAVASIPAAAAVAAAVTAATPALGYSEWL